MRERRRWPAALSAVCGFRAFRAAPPRARHVLIRALCAAATRISASDSPPRLASPRSTRPDPRSLAPLSPSLARSSHTRLRYGGRPHRLVTLSRRARRGDIHRPAVALATLTRVSDRRRRYVAVACGTVEFYGTAGYTGPCICSSYGADSAPDLSPFGSS